MSGYSKIDKLLHRLYLKNTFLSKASFDLEEQFFGKTSRKNKITQKVFITGLARSGTTALTQHIFKTDDYASLQYADMPYILLPNMWKNQKEIALRERSHKDGVFIDHNSPEAFDEYFWKVFLKNSYIKDNGLYTHNVSEEFIAKYERYISLICLSKNKSKYLSKNNNNILRLSSIAKIENSITIILYREPLSHAGSLLKLHELSCIHQKEDPFITEYYNYLGHHEFGENHKPFLLTEDFSIQKGLYKKNTLNYWLLIWKNYYQFLIDTFQSSYHLIAFEDFITTPEKVNTALTDILSISTLKSVGKKHIPSLYHFEDFNKDLLKECVRCYEKLEALKIPLSNS